MSRTRFPLVAAVAVVVAAAIAVLVATSDPLAAFVVLPGAVGFLQNFNASSFDSLVCGSSPWLHRRLLLRAP
jgi:hypothetical protein